MSKMVFRSKIEQAIPELEPFKVLNICTVGSEFPVQIFKNLAKIENVESLHRIGGKLEDHNKKFLLWSSFSSGSCEFPVLFKNLAKIENVESLHLLG